MVLLKPPLKKRILSDQTVDDQRVPLTYLSTVHATSTPWMSNRPVGKSRNDPWIRMARKSQVGDSKSPVLVKGQV